MVDILVKCVFTYVNDIFMFLSETVRKWQVYLEEFC